eukprot:TRINITY_DN1095_c0_g1_i1.p1 TRINITY_DN1095_c0_g1~~TRINITY_DN1095_c0_g1_i1.p1  ORF type:complete len:319 (-),score=58.47 TRINITY_DN1095_c0_g1_i1:25-981(-)
MELSLNQSLFNAVAKNELALCQELLAQGASCHWPNPELNNQTALDKALELEYTSISELLLRSSLQTAITNQDTSAIHPLVKSIVSLLKREPVSYTPSSSESISDAKQDDDLETRVERALRAFAAGDFVVVADSEDRENEGDLIIAAEKATPEKIAFLVYYATGLVCVSITGERCEQLELPQMVQKNTDHHGTAFTVSVDYKHGTSTGISAADRAATIRALANPNVTPADFHRPGHIFPLRARPGGVLVRPGHTEAAVDLCKMSTPPLYPAAAICELCHPDGTMIRGPKLKEFAARHNLCFLTIADMIAYRQLKNLIDI